MSTEQIDQLKWQAGQMSQQKKYSEAIDRYQDALNLAPDDVTIHEGIAIAYMYRARFEHAAYHFRRVTELNPQNPTGFINLGAALNKHGEYKQAIEALQSAIQRTSKSSEAFYNLAFAYRKTGQLDLSVLSYRESMRLSPKSPDTLINLAEVYAEMENFRQAIEFFRKALAMAPGNPRATRGLELAEREYNASRVMLSPFGRLVAEPNKDATESQLMAMNQLSVEERIQDRQNLATFGLSIEIAAKDLLEHVENELLENIAAVHNSVARGVQSSLPFLKLQRQFRTTARSVARARQQLRLRMQKLKAYEEQMAFRQQGG